MTLVVGWPPHRDDPAALHLAATLARSAGEDLLLVSVVPRAWPTPVASHVDRDFARWAEEYGDRAVASAREALAATCPDVAADAVAVAGSSVAGALVAEAERLAAPMVVVGSGVEGAWGTVVLGSTADRLLHSSPVPVALAPRGHRSDADLRVRRATCAFRGDDSSRTALRRAARICRGIGADLRVATFGVRGKVMYPPEVLGEGDVLAAYLARTSVAQDAAVAALGELTPAHVETTVATGATWAEALERLAWQPGDLLVVGSSSASLMSRLFLGSNATKIVRSSPVPVVVVP